MSLTPTDLTKIKKLVNTIVNPRFESIDERFGKIDERFGKIDERFDGVDRRFGKIDERFDGVDRRFEKIEEKIDGLPTRDEFLTKMDEVITELQATRQEQVFISHRTFDLEDRVSALEKGNPKHP